MLGLDWQHQLSPAGVIT